MDGSCGSVSLDRYWNNVAIPFLFIVLGFGLFVLFSLSDIQFSSTEKIVNMVGAIASSVPLSRSRGDEDEPPPPPPPPPPAGKATPPPSNVKPSAGKATPPPSNVKPSAGNAKPPPPSAGNASRKLLTNVENMSKGVGKSPPAKNAPTAPATNANMQAQLQQGVGK
jgi:hypothetical protein